MGISLFRRSRDTRSFPRGATIFTQGEAGDLMYVIVAGLVDVVVDGATIATRSVGETIGEMAFIDGRPRSATAIARTDCALAPIDRRNFQFLLDHTPQFAAQLLRLLSDRLREQHPPAQGEPGLDADAADQGADAEGAAAEADLPPEDGRFGLLARWLIHPDGALSAQWVTVGY